MGLAPYLKYSKTFSDSRSIIGGSSNWNIQQPVGPASLYLRILIQYSWTDLEKSCFGNRNGSLILLVQTRKQAGVLQYALGRAVTFISPEDLHRNCKGHRTTCAMEAGNNKTDTSSVCLLKVCLTHTPLPKVPLNRYQTSTLPTSGRASHQVSKTVLCLELDIGMHLRS